MHFHNDEIIHGIPSKKRVIREGDIVSIDLGAKIHGYNGDNAATFAAGKVSDEAKRLCDTTKESLYKGIEAAVAGGRLGDVGHAVQSYCEDRGYGVVREYTGHGVGTKLHEDPSVPNFGTPGRGVRLLPGMVIAIEPMINEGTAAIKQMPDGWTVKTKDGKTISSFRAHRGDNRKRSAHLNTSVTEVSRILGSGLKALLKLVRLLLCQNRI